jgi:hypothetical protein
MCTKTPHGALGRPCEDCLGDRISWTAQQANRERSALTPLWARQRRFRVRLATDEMVRRWMPLTA